MREYIVTRLLEASTIRGLILFVSGLLGAVLTESQSQAIVSVGLMLAGMIGAGAPDKFTKKND